ncbi:MAG TPA: hypothetical protein DCS64_10720, partial [Algoriphagus sp.]|nr:hypothetical protein [Algoriphagus sp.]
MDDSRNKKVGLQFNQKPKQMQERGINSTFKKIIYESSEMVFLADDTYPYNIFYANESFEEFIGESLKERNL